MAEDSAASCAALNVNLREQADSCDNAFAALVQRHSAFVFRVAYAVLRNVQDAEDAVQETFFKIYRLGSWTAIQDERAFLARAAWRIAVGRVRRADSGQPLAEAADASPNAEASLIQEDSDALVHRLIDALPEDLRQPLALSTVEAMTSPEIAKVNGDSRRDRPDKAVAGARNLENYSAVEPLDGLEKRVLSRVRGTAPRRGLAGALTWRWAGGLAAAGCLAVLLLTHRPRAVETAPVTRAAVATKHDVVTNRVAVEHRARVRVRKRVVRVPLMSDEEALLVRFVTADPDGQPRS